MSAAEVSVSVLLTQAADRLEELAAPCEPGQWIAETGWHGQAWVNTPGYKHAFALHGFVEESRWIAALSPVVAAPLAEWLRDAARRCEAQPEFDPSGFTARRTAIEFARAVPGVDRT